MNKFIELSANRSVYYVNTDQITFIQKFESDKKTTCRVYFINGYKDVDQSYEEILTLIKK